MRIILFGCFTYALLAVCNASISGPFLFWGHERVVNLQPRALLEASETEFSALYKEAKAVVIFVRNSTSRLEGTRYPKFQQLVKESAWAYLPQHILQADPVNYNTNVEVINLSGNVEEEDNELLAGFNEAVTIYGDGEVLGILANRDDESHFIAKREAAKEVSEAAGDDANRFTSTTSPVSDETDASYIFVDDNKKAILYATSAPIVTVPSQSMNNTKLEEHLKNSVTFDDQKAKGYSRLNIIFNHPEGKVFLRFNFSISRGNWAMKSVEFEHKDYKVVLPILGNAYDVPYAPIHFSYRCASRPMVFAKEQDTVIINDYQVQPWLDGASKFGDVYDCIGFTTAPIWAGILISLFLCGILSIGLLAIMDIKTPNRFESSRSKQLTFTVQE